MTHPALTVSAIVPVHNGAALVGDALRSIREQTRPVDEVIVVDDGSTDDTAAVVRAVDPEAILIRQRRCGPAAARNRGAERAGGALLGFLDHDDIWPPERSGALLDGFAATPEADLVCGRVSIRALGGEALDPRLAQADGTCVPFLFPALLIRREAWLAARGMEPAHDRAEDLDLYLRLVEAGVTITQIEATTLVYRLHGGNRSSSAALSATAMLATFRAAVLRRRRTFGDGDARDLQGRRPATATR